MKKKHTAIAYHRVREAVAAGIIEPYHVKGEHNPADVLTKALLLRVNSSSTSRASFGEVTISVAERLSFTLGTISNPAAAAAALLYQ